MLGLFEAGGSKTDFVFGNHSEIKHRISIGIHPMFMDAQAIEGVLDGLLNGLDVRDFTNIWFYGASCGAHEASEKVYAVLAKKLPGAQISVESDLLGTARALCGTKPGFAAILGTGSNACVFDGERITDRMVSFGFWLGDEGSGAYLGKKVFRAWLKGQLPTDLMEQTEEEFMAPKNKALQSLIDDPNPNARAAKLGGLAIRNKNNPIFREMVLKSIDDFFAENSVLISSAESLPFHFSGSVAFYLQEEIKAKLRSLGKEAGVFASRTIDRLYDFHLNLSETKYGSTK